MKLFFTLQTPGIASDWTFFVPWMEQHVNLTLAMGKPLVLEELGKDVVVNETANVLETSIATTRLPFMQMVYGQYNQSLQTGGNWRGVSHGLQTFLKCCFT